MRAVATCPPRRGQTKSWSWRDALLGEGGRRGSRWREGSPAGPGVQRRRRARLVCACVCRLGTAAGTDSARIAPRPGLLALGHSGRPWGPREGGRAAARAYGALQGLGPHPRQPGGPGEGRRSPGLEAVLKWPELTLNDAPGLDNPYLEYLMWLPLLLNAKHLILQDLTF